MAQADSLDYQGGMSASGGTTRQQKSIFFASFMTLVAAGVGFGVRGGLLTELGGQFGLTKSDLGNITGGGLAGFGFTIIFFSFFADRVGYKALLIGGFVLHILSAVVQVAATPMFAAAGKSAAYYCLLWGAFIFSLGNGLCEAAINPLTATLFPRNKTHYLNILHAGWPLGLVIGGLINFFFAGKVRWEVMIPLYALPALYYGIVVIKSHFPISEARAAGLSVGQMIKHVMAPLLIFLFVLHAMVGYVELGTDGWVQDILNGVIGNKAFLLFVYTSMLMFILRFFAGPIVHKINPIGLLFISAIFGAVGLYLLGTVKADGTSAAVVFAFAAATVFALGKTFYWPTMLGVIGERFPKAGAIAMGLSGGIGMLSAGLLGGPGIGYTQDRQALEHLQTASPEAYARVKSEQSNQFLFFPPIQGLDGAKVKVVTDTPPGKTLAEDVAFAAKVGKPDDNLTKLNEWFDTVEKPHAEMDKPVVHDATIFGGKRALQITATVPTAMAVGYLLIVFYFMAKGGYKAVHLDASGREIEVSHKNSPVENETGGTTGPMEA